jgi:4-amino-4-deoxy-L-arabinose transferase-like glycosyltransferase
MGIPPRGRSPQLSGADASSTIVSQLMGLWLALVFGLVLRLGPIILADFPLGDGGLFASMALDLRLAGFALPEFASYNGGGIPFMYPPLGLYAIAAIPGDPIATLRWLPLVWSLMAIAGAWLLVRELTDETTATVAAILFAAMPLAWAIEGGGVTRALGLALLYLALWAVTRAFRTSRFRYAILGGGVTGLALLSHPAVAPTAVAVTALFLAFRFSRRNAVLWIVVGLVAAAIAVPWILLITSRHGVDALVAGFTSHDEESVLTRLLVYGPTWIGPMDIVIGAALLGVAVSIARHQWLPVAWLVLMIAVPGAGGRYATLVWALLAAIGIGSIRPALQAQGAERIALAGAAGLLFITSLVAGYQRFHAIPSSVRSEMAEVDGATPVDARFAVHAPGPLGESEIEWFPVLARRVSVGTYMGLEWAPDRWDEARRLNTAIHDGALPAEANHVFFVNGDKASFQRLASP